MQAEMIEIMQYKNDIIDKKYDEIKELRDKENFESPIDGGKDYFESLRCWGYPCASERGNAAKSTSPSCRSACAISLEQAGRRTITLNIRSSSNVCLHFARRLSFRRLSHSRVLVLNAANNFPWPAMMNRGLNVDGTLRANTSSKTNGEADPQPTKSGGLWRRAIRQPHGKTTEAFTAVNKCIEEACLELRVIKQKFYIARRCFRSYFICCR